MDALLNLLRTILGAQVITQYIVMCDCRFLLTEDNTVLVRAREHVPTDGKCESCEGKIRMYGVHHQSATDDDEPTVELAHLVRFDPMTGEPAID